MNKTLTILVLIASYCFLFTEEAKGQSLLSDKAMVSNHYVHSSGVADSYSSPLQSAPSAIQPAIVTQISWHGVGQTQFFSSGSKNASNIQPIAVAQPRLRRVAHDEWEDDDDDDDDNWTQTGGQGDGNGNAGDPEKDPISVGDGYIMLILAATYLFVQLIKRKKNNIVTYNMPQALRQRDCFSWLDQSSHTRPD